ncbi:MAG: DUF5119 domain-containing protein [Bacteroidales bacterium]|nr:DUF5119 domain-containing protein [Bacteroidales bacterium]
MRKTVLIAALLVMLLPSCKRMPLYNKETKLELELQLDLDLELELDLDVDVDIELEAASIKIPEYLKTNFFSPSNGDIQYTQFVGPEGGQLSIGPGRYIMLIYSFGTEYVQIRGENNLNTIEAFTSDITASKMHSLEKFYKNNTKADELNEPIIYAPDHLLVTVQEVEIPEFTGVSQTITISSQVRTIVETYTFEVHSVIGAEYIESAEAFITNQAQSSFFGRGEVNTTPATIYFPVGVDKKKGCLYTVFNTFGKLPGTSESLLHILVRDTGGNEYVITTDITDQFDNDPDHEHHIVIEEEVDIPEPESNAGGIAPTVDQWDEENVDVPIG